VAKQKSSTVQMLIWSLRGIRESKIPCYFKVRTVIYLLRLLNWINGSVINANVNNVHGCSIDSLVMPAPDEVNLSSAKACEPIR
jgi:hypothetical protein